MSNYYGYGIDTSSDDFKLKPDAAKLLWKMAKNIDWIEETYEAYCADKNLNPDDGYEEAYIEDYENEFACSTGFEALLTDVINEFVDPAENPFVYDDCVIVVPATIPANDTEKTSMLTQQRIREILAEYINPLIEKPVVVGWYQVRE